MRGLVRCAAVVALAVVPMSAAAQDQPTAGVVTVTPTDGALEPFAAAVERVARARLEALQAVRVSGAAALSLADLQLAAGCIGDGEECLREVAQEVGVDLLFWATVDRAGEKRIVTVHMFDRRGHGGPVRVQRQGEEADLVEEVEPMLRELLHLPPMPHVDAAVRGGHGMHDDAQPPPPRDATWLIASLSSFGVAALAAIAGTIGGVMELDSAHAWETAPTGTREEIDAAISLRNRADAEATFTNVMFVVAGVAAAAGVTFLVLDLSTSSPSPESRARVALVPAGSGLALRGTW
jgi:hypothetical protein